MSVRRSKSEQPPPDRVENRKTMWYDNLIQLFDTPAIYLRNSQAAIRLKKFIFAGFLRAELQPGTQDQPPMTPREANNRKKTNIYMTNLSVIAIVVMVLVTIASVFVYRTLIHNAMKLDVGGNKFYTYHIAMVTESQSDPFWKNVWLAASKEGSQMDAYVEWIGSSFAEQFPLAMHVETVVLMSKVQK